METITNNFVIKLATVNGSGSQTANFVLLKTIFRMGIPIGSKNFFPSNIQGMPTWFQIRVNENGFTGHIPEVDIFINQNVKTLEQDIKSIKPNGVFIYDQDALSTKPETNDLIVYTVPFKKLNQELDIPVKYKKFCLSMIYVGFLCELLQLDSAALEQVIQDQFKGKEEALSANLKAVTVGSAFYREQYSDRERKFICKKIPIKINQVLMDGNTAAGMGLVFGGCSFMSWYPITPSTSVVESFSRFASKQIVLQAEDELSAICMVLGAGWAGARALTATSGPGLSLMSEAAGYAYYAEIPSVIWDVQRAGPSTGLPTRTAQGDMLFAHFISHGDARHICLIPGNLQESFEFGQTCFDLAETLQCLVIVLADLDLGMNYWTEEKWNYPNKPFQRGHLVSKKDLDDGVSFERYKDTNGDGIPARTIPGNKHVKAGYFTRGSGHDINANYTENPKSYREVLDRLDRKWQTAKNLVPRPILSLKNNSRGILYAGPLDVVLYEALDNLKNKNIELDYCRIRALPFQKDVESFLETHDIIYVVDQNQTAQIKSLLSMEYPKYASKLSSIRNFDGQPLSASILIDAVAKDL